MRNLYHTFHKPLLGSQLDLAHPLAQGLDYCYLCNEGSGAPVDLVGRGATAMSGGVVWTGSQTGDALKFDGISGSIAGTYQNSATITLAARIKTSATGVVQILAIKDSTTRTFQFRINPGNVVEMILFNAASSAFFATGSQVVTDGKEHVVVGTWDGVNAGIYVDGRLDTMTPLAFTLRTDGTSPLNLGASVFYSLFFNGWIVWETAYRRALSGPEIAWLSEENYAYIAPPAVRRFYSLPASGGGGGVSMSGGLSIGAGRLGVGI
jgi:hypothetical protein